MAGQMICRVHGDLDEKHISHTVKRGKPFDVCKLCRSISLQKHLVKHFGKCPNHGALPPDLIRKDGKCKLCHRVSANKKRNENREWFNDKMAKDREKNPDKWKEIYKKNYEYNRQKYRQLYSLKKCCDRFGITIEKYQEIHDRQNGKCAICHLPERRINGVSKMVGRLAIDHCHKTNKFRGLICHNCNTAIGKLDDDPVRMLRAVRYIKQGGF